MEKLLAEQRDEYIEFNRQEFMLIKEISNIKTIDSQDFPLEYQGRVNFYDMKVKEMQLKKDLYENIVSKEKELIDNVFFKIRDNTYCKFNATAENLDMIERWINNDGLSVDLIVKAINDSYTRQEINTIGFLRLASSFTEIQNRDDYGHLCKADNILSLWNKNEIKTIHNFYKSYSNKFLKETMLEQRKEYDEWNKLIDKYVSHLNGVNTNIKTELEGSDYVKYYSDMEFEETLLEDERKSLESKIVNSNNIFYEIYNRSVFDRNDKYALDIISNWIERGFDQYTIMESVKRTKNIESADELLSEWDSNNKKTIEDFSENFIDNKELSKQEKREIKERWFMPIGNMKWERGSINDNIRKILSEKELNYLNTFNGDIIVNFDGSNNWQKVRCNLVDSENKIYEVYIDFDDVVLMEERKLERDNQLKDISQGSGDKQLSNNTQTFNNVVRMGRSL